MERLRKLQNHPVALIVLWLPTIALLPGDWITIGGAVTSNTNLTRLVLGMAGFLAILWATGRLSGTGQGIPARDASEMPEKPLGHSPVERRQRSSHHSLPDQSQVPGRLYGGAAIGAAIRQGAEQEEARATFEAVEAEIALAYEEVLEMTKLLHAEWPHITPDGALVQAVLPDWRAKTTDFIGAILGSAQRAAFRGAATGANDLERLESEGRFLSNLGVGLTPDAIRVDEGEFLSARAARREHEAATFLVYDNFRAPGAPIDQEPLGPRIDALMREGIDLVTELSAPVQPERTASGNLKVSGKDAPDEWWEKADAFFQRATDLLTEGQPALLKDFEDGFNAHLHKQRGDTPPDHANDRRSMVEKMLALANAMRSTPREIVEASLDGLTEARRRLGQSKSI